MTFLELCCFGDAKKAGCQFCSCNFSNIDDSHGLRHGGDCTIHVPARSSPSSSCLMKFGSSAWSACLSFPEATFMRFMKSCKERFCHDWVELIQWPMIWIASEYNMQNTEFRTQSTLSSGHHYCNLTLFLWTMKNVTVTRCGRWLVVNFLLKSL